MKYLCSAYIGDYMEVETVRSLSGDGADIIFDMFNTDEYDNEINATVILTKEQAMKLVLQIQTALYDGERHEELIPDRQGEELI